MLGLAVNEIASNKIDSSTTMRSSRRIESVVLVCALLATALSFSSSLNGTFIWDDRTLIERNRYIKDLDFLGRNLTHSFWDVGLASEGDQAGTHANLYIRPLVTLSFMVDYQLYGLTPWGYHLTNLALHLLVVALAFCFLRRYFTEQPAVLAVVLLIFALHPSRTEAVSWISGRTDILMSVFFLMSLLSFRRWMSSQTPDYPRWGWYAFTWIAYILALLCKETAVALSMIMPVYVWVLLQDVRNRGIYRRVFMGIAPFLVVTFAFVLFRAIWQSQHTVDRVTLSIWQRTTTIFESIGYYAQLLMNPYAPNIQVGAFYDPSQPSLMRVSLGFLIGVVFIFGAAWLIFRRKRAGLMLTIALASLLPVVNLIPTGLEVLVAERFLYLPVLGIAGAIGVMLVSASPFLKRAMTIALSLVIVTWGTVNYVRGFDYRDHERFWRATLETSPDNPKIQHLLGVVLVEKKRLNEAEELFFRSFKNWQRIGVNQLSVLITMIDVHLLRTSDFQVAELETIAHFVASLLDTDRARREKVALTLGEKRIQFQLTTNESEALLHRSRNSLETMLGVVLSRLGRDDEAIARLKRASAEKGARLESSVNLALAYARLLDFSSAKHEIESLRRLEPDSETITSLERAIVTCESLSLGLSSNARDLTQRNTETVEEFETLAQMFMILQSPRRALDFLERAIAKRPDKRENHAMLALQFAAHGEHRRALDAIARARTLFGDEPGLAELTDRVHAAYAQWIKDRR